MNDKYQIFSQYVESKKQEVINYKTELESEKNELQIILHEHKTENQKTFLNIVKLNEITDRINNIEKIIGEIELQKSDFRFTYPLELIDSLDHISIVNELTIRGIARIIIDAYGELEVCYQNNITFKNYADRVNAIKNSVEKNQTFSSKTIDLDRLPKDPKTIMEQLKLNLKLMEISDNSINEIISVISGAIANTERVPRNLKKKNGDQTDMEAKEFLKRLKQSKLFKKFVK